MMQPSASALGELEGRKSGESWRWSYAQKAFV
jgi:hypothetical protein